ncbi:hypothetical protein ACFWB0_22240 [Rhodococcus sp. NPDC060086]|uniref:hypothetical protein n=1 Tax=Rhodococcus sp. NPDC060086 TaxID=3347055 RepID=UPI003659FFE3
MVPPGIGAAGAVRRLVHHSPLQVAPEALALFLREHPAAVATQRQRRLSAINAVHTRRYYPPGGAPRPSVRHHLDAGRADRLERIAPLLLKAALVLPVAGWSAAGVFGRRDALLLVLASTGMNFTDLRSSR